MKLNYFNIDSHNWLDLDHMKQLSLEIIRFNSRRN